jgi:type IV secretion system protein VirB8
MIAVNHQTGEITVLKELEGHAFSANWAINRYFINQYLQLRQGYSWDDIKRRFNLVISMSDELIAKEYIANTMDTNPTSPLVLLNKNFYRDVTVLSINQLNSNTAMARFKTMTHDKNNPADIKTEDWQVVLKWEYVNPAESQQERDKNPLGFHITYYQLSPVFAGN